MSEPIDARSIERNNLVELVEAYQKDLARSVARETDLEQALSELIVERDGLLARVKKLETVE